MLKIGAFSRLCRVPVFALRYYADLGLLPPAEVDPFTGYRYYTLGQLPWLHRSKPGRGTSWHLPRDVLAVLPDSRTRQAGIDSEIRYSLKRVRQGAVSLATMAAMRRRRVSGTLAVSTCRTCSLRAE